MDGKYLGLFWAKVAKKGPDECWLWTASRLKFFGHGQFWARKADGKLMPEPAHRSSWKINVGPIPEGMCVLHRCDVPTCVNPAHLFLGSRADNIADMVAKGRQARGESKRGTRLTESQVVSMRNAVAAGNPQIDVAAQFGISQGHLCQIVHRKVWAHV